MLYFFISFQSFFILLRFSKSNLNLRKEPGCVFFLSFKKNNETLNKGTIY